MLKKTIISCILLVILIWSCAPLEKSKKGIRLQYKFNEGDVVKYNVSTISKGTITMSGLPIEDTSIPPMAMETKTECIFTQKVIGVEKGEVANVEITYDSFKQDIKIGKEEISLPIFGKKEENPFLNFLEGKKFNIKITRDGSILEIKGVEEVFDQILAQMPDEIPDDFIHKFKEEFGKTIIGAVEKNYQRFPLEEMKVGDMWIQELDYNIPFFGTTLGEFTYTIEGFKQIEGLECVKIGIETTMNFDEKEIEVLQQLNIPSLEVKFKGDAHGKGNMLFAYQQGKLINTDLGMKINMEINYKGTAGEKEMSMGMKMDFDTQILVKLQ